MLKELVENYRSLSIIGMCKNAGKTTVLNRIIAELSPVCRMGLTSIGRDGESVDLVTHTHKPGIYVFEGTLIATAADLIRVCDITREIVASTGVNTPMGEVAVVRARSDGSVQLAGPSMTAQLKDVRELFFSLGAELVLIDGSISRKTLCAPAVSEATILCTGASYNKNISVVVEDTAFVKTLLTLPAQPAWDVNGLAGGRIFLKDESGVRATDMPLAEALRDKAFSNVSQIYVNGALTDAQLLPALTSNARLKDREITVQDGSKLLITGPTYDKLMIRGARLSVVDTTAVAAVTINPFSAYGFDFDRDEFMQRMSERVDVPVLNVGGI